MFPRNPNGLHGSLRASRKHARFTLISDLAEGESQKHPLFSQARKSPLSKGAGTARSGVSGVSRWRGCSRKANTYACQTTTRAERALWQGLKGRQRLGYKFRRQHVIDLYIADFYCAEAMMVIEVDGSVHEGREVQDANRDAELEQLGLTVLRFSNAAVINDFVGVIQEIDAYLRRV